MPVFLLDDSLAFPHPRFAEPDGLLAVGGDLRPERLILAYENAIFPWYSEGSPILWFSPNPRFILIPDEFRVSRSLKKIIKSDIYQVRFDTCFNRVIEECARIKRKDQHGTWITGDMIRAYIRLHEEGYAHSVETYHEGCLVGGLYGISLCGAFFGESMFYLMSNASKVALYFLVEKLKSWGFDFIDSQVPTEHMKRLGAKAIDRESYWTMLKSSLSKKTKRGRWTGI
jgi:leucyl/phenylalanyl-tRNA--protein transferase